MNEKNKKKSLERSKTTSTSLAKTFLSAGINFSFGGMPVYQVAEAGYKHLVKYSQDRNRDRVTDFCKRILEGNLTEDEKKKVLEGEISEHDYYTLLNHVIQDEEDEKTEVYARIYIKLVLGTMESDQKAILLRTVKDLTMYDIKLLRALFIKSDLRHFNQNVVNATINQMIVEDARTDITRECSITNLERFGLIKHEENITSAGRGKQRPSNLSKTILSAIFENNELTEKSYGKDQSWRI